VLRLIREHRWLFISGTLAALALRLFFFVYFPAITDDSRTYADIATNWLHHGIYGQTQGTEIVPTDTRLPGYPTFLAVIFFLFGAANFRAVMLAQILFDVASCLIIADIARRAVSERAARIAFVLAALCPFLANYPAAALTETLEIFFTCLALDCAITALDAMRETATPSASTSTSAPSLARPSQACTGHPLTLWAATGLAVALCILLRPDGGLLLAAVVFYLACVGAAALSCPASAPVAGSHANLRRILVAGAIVSACALAPLVPWTLRNFHTLHHFQPLAPRYANESDETAPRGFNRWVSTWMVDYASVEEIYWNVPGVRIDPQKLPARALASHQGDPNEKDATLALIADYNEDQDLTPELDARFDQLAASRRRAHPALCYLVLPVLRVADMWLRPRTELLPSDPRWWEFNDDAKGSITAVGFGVLNLVYMGAALFGIALAIVSTWARWRPRSEQPGAPCPRLRRPGLLLGLLLGFVLLRSAFLLTLENPEPRYTLECYPVVVICASLCLARVTQRRRHSD
jgi:hypothetical protein